VAEAKIDKPPALWREELRRAWRELRGAELSPARAAAAVALGLFIGSIPIFGCHTPLVLTICIILQLDALLAWCASHISNPFFAPFLMTAEVQVGAWVRTGAPIYIDRHTIQQEGLTGFAGFLFVGSPLVAAAIALTGALLVFTGMTVKRRFWPATVVKEPYRLPENAPPWWHATERVASRYSPLTTLSTTSARTRFHYVRVKLMTDPITKMIADAFGESPGILGEVLDIGCGRGQMPIVLLELGRATSARGVDWDAEKIEAARVAAATAPPLPAEFEVGDAQSTPYAAADTVMLIDVIHYLTIEEQDAVLERAARAVRPGGRLLVREADTERGFRSWMTLAEEKLFTLLRFNRGARVKFRPAREIVARLEEAGLACEVKPAWGGTPFSNVLILATRATSS
jgi:SAM-dependent methyltransferase/uncharacterized protein (DUF2062 family)